MSTLHCFAQEHSRVCIGLALFLITMICHGISLPKLKPDFMWVLKGLTITLAAVAYSVMDILFEGRSIGADAPTEYGALLFLGFQYPFVLMYCLRRAEEDIAASSSQRGSRPYLWQYWTSVAFEHLKIMVLFAVCRNTIIGWWFGLMAKLGAGPVMQAILLLVKWSFTSFVLEIFEPKSSGSEG